MDPLTLTDQQLSETLDTKIQSARIVAVGESVHGSSQFIKLQHRLTQYLVEKKKFRTVIMENPLIRSRGLTQWLKSCQVQNSGRDALKELPIDLLYTPIQEDVAFLNWLCRYNQKNPREPVVIRGMDIWDRPWEFQSLLESENKDLKLGWESELVKIRQHCLMHAESDWSRFDTIRTQVMNQGGIVNSDFEPCITTLNRLLGWANSRISGARLDRKYRLQSVAQVIVEARSWQQYLNAGPQGLAVAWDFRDLAQALNIQSIYEQEGSERSILLAHTSHTSKMESEADWWKLGPGAIRSAVSFLRERFKGKLVSIGLTAYEASGTQGVYELPTATDSLDRVLFIANYRLAAIDPDSGFVRQRERWWIQNENSKQDYVDGVHLIPRDHFDLYFFFAQSLVGEPVLPWRPVFEW